MPAGTRILTALTGNEYISLETAGGVQVYMSTANFLAGISTDNPTYKNLTLTGLLFESNQTGITAGTTRTRAGATALTLEVNRIDTSTAPAAGSSLGDGVVLMASVAGLDVTIINNTSNIVQVYAAGSDTINGVAGSTGLPIPPNCVEIFECPIAGSWYYDSGVGFSGALNTVLAVDTVSAGGTNSVTATVLNCDFNRLTTVAAGTGVMLPASAPGMDVYVLNHGANAVQVYGNGTDQIDDVAGTTGVPQMVRSVVLYTCYTAGNWYTNGLGTGYAGQIQTQGFTDAVAAAGTGQTNSTQINTSLVRVTSGSGGINLPTSAAGMVITVVNALTTTLSVFPVQGGSETINGIAAATGVVQMPNSIASYVCTVAGTWVAVGLGSGFSGSLATTSFADALSANSGGIQAGATPITTSQARFTTVGGAGYSAVLPTAAGGLNVTVINAGANILAVFPAGSDQINNSTNAFPVPVNNVVTFFTTVAGFWHTLTQPAPYLQKYNTNTTTTNAVALSGANLVGGQVEVTLNMTGTLGSVQQITLPSVAATVTALITAGINPNPGMTWGFNMMNTSAGNFAWQLGTSTGWTLNGTTTSVGQNTFRKYYVTLNSLTTATMQSLGQYTIGSVL